MGKGPRFWEVETTRARAEENVLGQSTAVFRSSSGQGRWWLAARQSGIQGQILPRDGGVSMPIHLKDL